MEADIRYVETFDEACEFMRWLGERRPALAIDTETGGLEWWLVRLRMVQFGDARTGWSLPWERWGGLAVDALKRMDQSTPLVFHNAKFDVHMLEHHAGIRLGDTSARAVHDTRLMAHVLDPTGAHGLKPLSTRLIDRNAANMADVLDTAMSKQKWTWDTVPIDFQPYWAYAALDTVLTARLYEILAPQITAKYAEVYELDRRSQDLLQRMERTGVRVDLPYTENAFGELEEYAASMKTYARQTWGINVTSDVQLRKKLIEEGVVLEKQTKGGQDSVDAEVLQSIDHPLAGVALATRRTKKISGTYLRNFLDLVDPWNRLHPSTNPLGARTGRMSMERPNLQNLPRDSKDNPLALTVRNCIIPSDERALVMADFEQIEQRIMAHYAAETAGDTGMLEAFASDDIFTEMACRIYNDPSIVKKDPRRQMTKNAAYAKAYGAGAEKFSLTAGVPTEQGRGFLNAYDAQFPGIVAFQNIVDRTARSRYKDEGECYVLSPFGRRHTSQLNKVYTLVNYLVQGTAGDVLKRQMLALDAAGLGDYMILPVHDEVIFDVPLEHVDDVKNLCAQIMPVPDMFRVPLTVEVESHDRWGAKYAG